jgi:hypothetical protein
MFIGFAYLVESFHVARSAAGYGELNLGIILDEKHRRKGFAAEALGLIVPYAFENIKCHRIQASIMNMPGKETVLKMLTRLCVPIPPWSKIVMYHTNLLPVDLLTKELVVDLSFAG